MRKISCLIPIFNEADSLQELHSRLNSTLRHKLSTYKTEIIFIDDGSTDHTPHIINQLRNQHPNIQIIRFSSNQGKSAALTAGFRQASGDIIVTLDGDLQDRPENIPALISLLHEGYDLVVGWKKIRHDPPQKTIPSRIFNVAIHLTWGLPLHDINCGLKVMKQPAAQIMNLSAHEHRFIPLFAYQAGFKVTELPVTHDARKNGHSKYGWSRLISGLSSYGSLFFRSKIQRSISHNNLSDSTTP